MLSRLVGKLVQKKMTPVKEGFSNVGKDMQLLHQYVSHIHYQTNQWDNYLHSKTNKIEDQVRKLKGAISTDVHTRVQDHVERVEESLSELKSEVTKKAKHNDVLVEELDTLKRHLTTVLTQYHKHILHLHKNQHSEQTIKEWIKEAVKEVGTPEPTIQREVLVEKSESPSLRQSASHLTAAQKTLLAMLAKASEPLSYRDLAALYGKSPSTIKTQLMSLRKSGIPIQEKSVDNVKRFWLDKQYKQIILSPNL